MIASDAKRGIVRDAVGIGIATGASQFAFAGVIAAAGSPWAGAAAAMLLGTRNALYGLRLTTLLEVSGVRRLLAAQLVIDETTAMAIARDKPAQSRFAFYATGVAIFSLWNLGTLAGAIATHALPDPKVLGFDAAPPAAFLALLAPRLRAREPLAIALAAALVALVLLPVVPAGVPLLVVAGLVVLYGLRRGSG